MGTRTDEQGVFFEDTNSKQEIENPEIVAGKIFDLLDTDHRGNIDPSMMVFHQRHAGQSSARNLYDELKTIQDMDVNNDSLISKDEFIQATKHKSHEELSNFMDSAEKFAIQHTKVEETKKERVLTEEDIDHARRIFRMIDHDNKGEIYPSRLIFHRRKSHLSDGNLFKELKEFEKFDLNGDSSVSEEEFISVYCDCETTVATKAFVDSFAKNIQSDQPPVPSTQHESKNQPSLGPTNSTLVQETSHNNNGTTEMDNENNNQNRNTEYIIEEKKQTFRLLARAVSKKCIQVESRFSVESTGTIPEDNETVVPEDNETVVPEQDKKQINSEVNEHVENKLDTKEANLSDESMEITGEVYQEIRDGNIESNQNKQNSGESTTILESEEIFFQDETLDASPEVYGKKDTVISSDEEILRQDETNIKIEVENLVSATDIQTTQSKIDLSIKEKDLNLDLKTSETEKPNNKLQNQDNSVFINPNSFTPKPRQTDEPESQQEVLLDVRNPKSDDNPKDFVGNDETNTKKSCCCCFPFLRNN